MKRHFEVIQGFQLELKRAEAMLRRHLHRSQGSIPGGHAVPAGGPAVTAGGPAGADRSRSCKGLSEGKALVTMKTLDSVILTDELKLSAWKASLVVLSFSFVINSVMFVNKYARPKPAWLLSRLTDGTQMC